MLSSGLRYELLGGPYTPPRTRRGAYLTCELRGKVKVGGYLNGPNPVAREVENPVTDSLRRFDRGRQIGIGNCRGPSLGGGHKNGAKVA